jgi:hypothetical protein
VPYESMGSNATNQLIFVRSLNEKNSKVPNPHFVAFSIVWIRRTQKINFDPIGDNWKELTGELNVREEIPGDA